MSDVIVVGTQWGDEGKGKIVDWLSKQADLVVRFQGGHNAGHTLVIDGATFALSMLPSGIVRPGKMSLISNGVVIEPWALFAEMQRLHERGIQVTPENLKISDAAPLILPLHSLLDQARETARGAGKIGTTGRGIGPAYEDKVARRTLRTGDLADRDLIETRLNGLYAHHEIMAAGLGYALPDRAALTADLIAIGEKLRPFLTPAWAFLNAARAQGQKIMFEGAQGAMLDIDHGTYPFVTSSNTQAGNAGLGSGFGAARQAHILGITKAYTTRVGAGPFPTEDAGPEGTKMGERGREFGVVTGRKRRCGWFDAPMVRQVVQIGDVQSLALTKLDVLDGFKTLKICVAYELRGQRLDHFPANQKDQAAVTPIYETLPGWTQTTKGAQSMDQLPCAAKAYVERLETLVGVPASIISTSPEREDSILRLDPFNDASPF